VREKKKTLTNVHRAAADLETYNRKTHVASYDDSSVRRSCVVQVESTAARTTRGHVSRITTTRAARAVTMFIIVVRVIRAATFWRRTPLGSETEFVVVVVVVAIVLTAHGDEQRTVREGRAKGETTLKNSCDVCEQTAFRGSL